MAPEIMFVKDNPKVSNWNIETGYGTKESRPNDYPIRVYNTKKQSALVVRMQLLEKDLEFLCKKDGKLFI